VRPALSSYLVVLGVAAFVTLVTVPLFRVIAVSKGFVDEPDERRSHDVPTAVLGGAAMYVGFLVSFGVAWYTGWFESTFSGSTEPLAVVMAATVAFAVGVSDDLRELSAPAKTAGLALVGSLLFAGGVNIIVFRIPFFDLLLLSLDLSFLLTVLWVLGLANAVNIIDGLDGLAAGIVAIGAGAFFLYAIKLSEVGLLLAGNIGPLIAAVLLGVCLGFLPWNIHPAKIFMGDGGSLLLGSLMAASTMAVGGRTSDPFSGQTFFFYAPLVIPFVILGVPILDTLFAIVRRASRRQGLATADKDHLHHRLIRLGHGHRRAVSVLWAWTALLSGFVLWPVYNEGRGDAIVPAGVVGLGALLYISLQPGFGRSHDSRLGPMPGSVRPHTDGVNDDCDVDRRSLHRRASDRGAIGPQGPGPIDVSSAQTMSERAEDEDGFSAADHLGKAQETRGAAPTSGARVSRSGHAQPDASPTAERPNRSARWSKATFRRSRPH
jgi:UDP-GlcNAc:undecaprenyl-phosphate/decaprenyl-phosphate GlcNAc-1-phosphate transferase